MAQVHDVEKGDPALEQAHFDGEPSGGGITEDDVMKESDEYGRLIKFIDLQAEKARNKRDDDVAADEESSGPAPWWKFWAKWSRSSANSGPMKVPSHWLETDMTVGLEESDVVIRRAKFGWNELER